MKNVKPMATPNSTENTIAKQKMEQKFMFQFINHENGQRSEPLVGNWDSISEVLELRKDSERPHNEDYILLVAVLDGKDTTIPSTPLITIKTFLNFKDTQ